MLRDHLDEVTAYGRVNDQLASIREFVADLAGAVGEALAEPDPKAVAEFCRYKPAKAGRGG